MSVVGDDRQYAHEEIGLLTVMCPAFDCRRRMWRWDRKGRLGHDLQHKLEVERWRYQALLREVQG